MPTTIGQTQLEAAGYTQVVSLRKGQWYSAVDPNGNECAILRQSQNCWHWFSKAHRATASGSSATTAHKGGLGDAIDTDSRMKTYKRLLGESRVPPVLRQYEGVYAAMQQV